MRARAKRSRLFPAVAVLTFVGIAVWLGLIGSVDDQAHEYTHTPYGDRTQFGINKNDSQNTVGLIGVALLVCSIIAAYLRHWVWWAVPFALAAVSFVLWAILADPIFFG